MSSAVLDDNSDLTKATVITTWSRACIRHTSASFSIKAPSSNPGQICTATLLPPRTHQHVHENSPLKISVVSSSGLRHLANRVSTLSPKVSLVSLQKLHNRILSRVTTVSPSAYGSVADISVLISAQLQCAAARSVAIRGSRHEGTDG